MQRIVPSFLMRLRLLNYFLVLWQLIVIQLLKKLFDRLLIYFTLHKLFLAINFFIYSIPFFFAADIRKSKFTPKSYRRSNNSSDDSEDEIQLHPEHRERLEFECESGMCELSFWRWWADWFIQIHAIKNKHIAQMVNVIHISHTQSDTGVDSGFEHFSIQLTHSTNRYARSLFAELKQQRKSNMRYNLGFIIFWIHSNVNRITNENSLMYRITTALCHSIMTLPIYAFYAYNLPYFRCERLFLWSSQCCTRIDRNSKIIQ